MAKHKKAQKDQAHWRHLFVFFPRNYFLLLFLAIFLSIASGIVVPALAVFFGRIFDTFTAYGTGKLTSTDLVSLVSTYAIGLAGLGCVSGLLNAGFYASWLVLGELQAKSARLGLFASLADKDMTWFDTQSCGIEALVIRLQRYE